MLVLLRSLINPVYSANKPNVVIMVTAYSTGVKLVSMVKAYFAAGTGVTYYRSSTSCNPLP